MRTKRTDKGITIKDVAKEAGVSIATVSRTLNDGSVRSKKKKQVLDAIEKLNYVPNESARNLAAIVYSKRLILVLPDISRSYYSELIKGCKDSTKMYLYDLIIEHYNYDEQKYKEFYDKYKITNDSKVMVQFARDEEIENKTIINTNSKYILYKGIETKKKIGIYSEDKYMIKFLNENFFNNMEEIKNNELNNYDYYIAPTLNEAIHLYNNGITNQTIYTFDNVDEIQKICTNIKLLDFDFYALGVILGRIAIKKNRNEDINDIIFSIRGFDE